MSACMTRIFLVEKVTFYVRTHLHHLIDSIVFFWNGFQLTISAGLTIRADLHTHQNFKKLACQFLMMQNLSMSKILV